jgi:DNA-binding transcriptional regulator YiaG
MKDSILDVVHQTATGLRKSEAISDVTMSEFDKLCLQHLAQSELAVQNNRLTEQEKVFDSLRASLLAKATEPVDVHHSSSDRQEK